MQQWWYGADGCLVQVLHHTVCAEIVACIIFELNCACIQQGTYKHSVILNFFTELSPMHYSSNSYTIHSFYALCVALEQNIITLHRYTEVDKKKNKNIPLTPLSAAAKEGKHETAAYLLSLPDVTPEGVKPSELQVCFSRCIQQKHSR